MSMNEYRIAIFGAMALDIIREHSRQIPYFNELRAALGSSDVNDDGQKAVFASNDKRMEITCKPYNDDGIADVVFSYSQHSETGKKTKKSVKEYATLRMAVSAGREVLSVVSNGRRETLIYRADGLKTHEISNQHWTFPEKE